MENYPTAPLFNVTAQNLRNLEIKVGISYESDLLLAKQILRELIEKDPELLDREETQVFVDELGDSAVILGLRAWVKTERILEYQVAYE